MACSHTMLAGYYGVGEGVEDELAWHDGQDFAVGLAAPAR